MRGRQVGGGGNRGDRAAGAPALHPLPRRLPGAVHVCDHARGLLPGAVRGQTRPLLRLQQLQPRRVRVLRTRRKRRLQRDFRQVHRVQRTVGAKNRDLPRSLHQDTQGLLRAVAGTERDSHCPPQQENLRFQGFRGGGVQPLRPLLPGRKRAAARDRRALPPDLRHREGLRRGTLQGGAGAHRHAHRPLGHAAVPVDGKGVHRVEQDRASGEHHRAAAVLPRGQREEDVGRGRPQPRDNWQEGHLRRLSGGGLLQVPQRLLTRGAVGAGVYRGTSLIKNCPPPPRTTIGPQA
mmetsp:Transcript_60776/g.138938  ORF Transcript_60776/g.138938 Transcript_60776/m.138938 type:complete len:292 (+) Transcript_60776:480-1355(+)